MSGPESSAAELAAAELAARLNAEAPGYLDRVREATARLGAPPAGGAGDLRAALGDLEVATGVDLDPPAMSARRGAAVVKTGVKALVGWYVRYLGQQMVVLGQSVHRLGAALVAHAEEQDARTARLREDLERLAARVDRLERPGP